MHTLQWIKSFLTNRRQRVRANGELSEFKPVLSGVPQVSILAPVLFTLYVNDIPSELETLIFLYADDTKIYSAITSESSTVSSGQGLVKRIPICLHLRPLTSAYIL